MVGAWNNYDLPRIENDTCQVAVHRPDGLGFDIIVYQKRSSVAYLNDEILEIGSLYP